MAADQGVPRSPSLYRKVAEDIKAAIAAGGYAAGTRLPAEHDLAERYCPASSWSPVQADAA
jgi:DNA-binding GntR family transcriptional regulator